MQQTVPQGYLDRVDNPTTRLAGSRPTEPTLEIRAKPQGFTLPF